MSATIVPNAEPAPAELAYHDPKTAPTLARIERLVGHPIDAEKLRAKLDAAQATVEAAPVQTLGAEAPPVSGREPRAYYLVSVGAGPASYDHRSELKALVSIALGVPAQMVLFSAASRVVEIDGAEWGDRPEPLVHLYA